MVITDTTHIFTATKHLLDQRTVTFAKARKLECVIVCNSHVAFGEVLKRLSVPLWFSWVVGPGIGHAVICCFVFDSQVCTCTTDIKCCETLMIW